MFDLLAAKPAGGAALDQVAIASGAALVVTFALMWLGLGHRSGRVALLGRLGTFSQRVSGLPAWAAIPAGMIVVSLITALFGMLLGHLPAHRAGPRRGPAGQRRPLLHPRRAVRRLRRRRSSRCACRWSARAASRCGSPTTGTRPLGGVLIAAAGGVLADRLPARRRLAPAVRPGRDAVGPDAPDADRRRGDDARRAGRAVRRGACGQPAPPGAAASSRGRAACAASRCRGALLLGLSTFQAEFDFGVPQFRMIFQPMLIMLAAGVALVAARIWLGRGAALGAALFFLAMRGVMALLVGPVLGEPTPHFPLYVGRGAAGRADRAARAPRRCRWRSRCGRRDRHGRPGRRVGLDARVDAAALARRAGAGGRLFGLVDRASRAACVGGLARRAAERGPHAVAAARRRARAARWSSSC